MIEIINKCNEMNDFCSSANCDDGLPFGFPKKIVLGTPKIAITSAIAGKPTATEVQAYIDAGNGVAFDVTNGLKMPSEVTTKDGADTYTNTPEVVQEMEGISFTIRKITNATALAIKKNNLNFTQMRLFWVDSKNRWHGGSTGYLVPNYIKSWEHAGFGETAIIPVELKWITDMYSYIDVLDADVSYSEISCFEGTFTETAVTSYTLGYVQGYRGITGWDKDTYPTLYAKYMHGVISFYTSASDRTAETGAVASIDSAISLTVNEVSSSGFGGELSFVSNGFVDGAEWNVTFN